MSSQLKQDIDNTYLELTLHGWGQHPHVYETNRPDAPVCLEMAVALAVTGDRGNWASSGHPRMDDVCETLRGMLWPEHACDNFDFPLWRWNDAPYRTEEDVKALIKQAWEATE